MGKTKAVDYHSDHGGTQLNYEVLSEAVSPLSVAAYRWVQVEKRIDEGL